MVGARVTSQHMNSDEDEMADELFSVSGQTVLISGGSRGIGEAIAVGFARRGATTIITGRHTETLAETARRHEADGVTLEICECDVSQRESIDRCVRDTLERFGKIDTLVNVAGVNRRKPCLEVTDEDFDFVLDINLRGAFLMSREVGRHALARGERQRDDARYETEGARVARDGLGCRHRKILRQWRHGHRRYLLREHTRR